MMLNSWNCFQFSSGFVNGKTLGWKLKYLGTVLETAKEKSFFLPENRHQVKFSLKSHIILDEKDLLWCKSKEGEKIAFVASNIYLTFISLLFFFSFFYTFLLSQQEKQQTPNKRPWEGIRKVQSPPSWVKKDIEPVAQSPLELKTVEWEKTGATIPLVGQDIIDLQTEVWAEGEERDFFFQKTNETNKQNHVLKKWLN